MRQAAAGVVGRDAHAERPRLARTVLVASDADANVRRNAAWALGQLGQNASRAALTKAVGDPSGLVNMTAKVALGSRSTDSLSPLFRAVLIGTVGSSRRRHFTFLGKMQSICEGPFSIVGLVCAATVACTDPAPGHTYFERNIQPILQQKCAGNTSGCHSTNVGDDSSQVRRRQLRRHVVRERPEASRSARAVRRLPVRAAPHQGCRRPERSCSSRTAASSCRSTVQHSGGAILEPGADAFYTLQTWIDNGATENGLKPATPAQVGAGTCSTAVPSGFDPSAYMANANFATFKSTVQPILEKHSCNAGNCHGAPQSDFYITCGGTDDTQLAFNFSQAWAFVNDPVADSQILRIPLAVGPRGRGPTGRRSVRVDRRRRLQGDRGVGDGGRQARLRGRRHGEAVLRRQRRADPPAARLLVPGLPLAASAERLQAAQWHAAGLLLRDRARQELRPPAQQLHGDGVRGCAAQSRGRQDAAPRRSARDHGRRHRPSRRAGARDPGHDRADPAMCAAPFDPTTATAFCTIQEWVRLERAALGTSR